MGRNQRLGLLGVAAVIAVVAIVVAVSSGGSSKKSSTSTPQQAHVDVVNAKPVGGIKKITFKKGGTVDLTITSDTADEVHFHGYDVHKDVAKGGTVRFRFPAKIDGAFVVELENHKQQIAEVDVLP